mmetsp:Transcript_22653/g.29021  ORF Transcript_22653/g.29021 Transcript_22653/m.29021 type:complete len:91 (-) Transcript_22653:577-849(-)
MISNFLRKYLNPYLSIDQNYIIASLSPMEAGLEQLVPHFVVDMNECVIHTPRREVIEQIPNVNEMLTSPRKEKIKPPMKPPNFPIPAEKP